MTAAMFDAEDAFCRGTGADPDAWFQDSTTPPQARELCRLCPTPIRDACLNYAIPRPVVGVWGGTTPGERARIRRDLGIPLRWETVAEKAQSMCNRGHDLTLPDAVMFIPRPDRTSPERRCRECHRELLAERKARRRAMKEATDDVA